MSADALLDPIRAHLAELGFELVDLRRTGTQNRPIFQLRVDRPESRPGHGVTVEDCARISRSLEVSSPGIGFRGRNRQGAAKGASDTGETDGRID